MLGSYARGALTVGDVGADIECEANLGPVVHAGLFDRLARLALEHAVSQVS